MDRGAWQATDHEITRVGHDLVTKPPPQQKLTQLCKATLAQLKKKKKLLYPITLSVEAIKKICFIHTRKKSLSFLEKLRFQVFLFFFKLHHWKLTDCILEYKQFETIVIEKNLQLTPQDNPDFNIKFSTLGEMG